MGAAKVGKDKTVKAMKTAFASPGTRRASSDGSVSKPNKLLNAHLKEIHDKGAEAYNIGKYVDDKSIGSKTDKGYLASSQNAAGAITHSWADDNPSDAVQ